MKTVKTTEKFDGSGNLIERVTETVETFETAPFIAPQPSLVPFGPYYPTLPSLPPLITWTSGGMGGGIGSGGLQ